MQSIIGILGFGFISIEAILASVCHDSFIVGFSCSFKDDLVTFIWGVVLMVVY